MHDELEQEYIEEEYDAVDTSGPFHIDCAFCSGTGVHPGTMKSLTHRHCPICQGKGMLQITGSRKDIDVCAQCGGTGRDLNSTPVEPCRVCGGYGLVLLSKP